MLAGRGGEREGLTHIRICVTSLSLSKFFMINKILIGSEAQPGLKTTDSTCAGLSFPIWKMVEYKSHPCSKAVMMVSLTWERALKINDGDYYSTHWTSNWPQQ